jgi:hypothetical protein
VAQIIGQEQFNDAVRLDHFGDDRIEAPVALLAGDVLLDGPAPPSLGLVEETSVHPPQSKLKGRVIRPCMIHHEPSLLHRRSDAAVDK